MRLPLLLCTLALAVCLMDAHNGTSSPKKLKRLAKAAAAKGEGKPPQVPKAAPADAAQVHQKRAKAQQKGGKKVVPVPEHAPAVGAIGHQEALRQIHASNEDAAKKAYKTALIGDLRNLRCEEAMAGGWAGKRVQLSAETENRIRADDPQLSIHCEDIKIKPQFASNWWKFGAKCDAESCRRDAHSQRRDFKLAFVRLVKQDYFFIEAELSANFEPQNVYCFAVDPSAHPNFKSRMTQMAHCFGENVVVLVDAKKPLKMGSARQFAGTNSQAVLQCMQALDQKQWEYALVLENHDVQLKTNAEIVRILQTLGGASDIQYTPAAESATDIGGTAHRKIVKNAHSKEKTEELLAQRGHIQAALSRKFVDEVLLSKTVRQKELIRFYNSLNAKAPNVNNVDEFFFPTMATLSGHFAKTCQQTLVPSLMRFNIWVDKRREQCRSGLEQDGLCVFGMEDLGEHLAHAHHLFATKMMPQHDAGAIHCWHRHMHRSYERQEELARQLQLDVYAKLPQVQFHRADKAFSCRYEFLYGKLGDYLGCSKGRGGEAKCAYKDIFEAQALSDHELAALLDKRQ